LIKDDGGVCIADPGPWTTVNMTISVPMGIDLHVCQRSLVITIDRSSLLGQYERIS
jgi:hypothetical protein